MRTTRIMRGSHNEKLPERFDDQITLEIEDESEGIPTIRMQDESTPEAWISLDVRGLVSLPEYE